MLISIIGAILLLGLVIFGHELSHFLVAKFFRVKVLKFSVGFGPSLWRKQIGETEYQVAAFPLGGFVKMQGETAEEKDQDPRSYLNKPILQRAMIVVAGPVGNLILPVVALGFMYMVGVSEVTPRIQRVEPMTFAAKKGLRAGDLVRHVDGKPVRTWTEVEELVPEKGHVTLVVERGGQRVGYPIPVDEFKHLSPYPYEPLLAVRRGSPAESVGFRNSDRAVKVGPTEVKTWEEFAASIQDAAYPLSITVDREGKPAEIHLQTAQEMAGIEQPELYIAQVMPDSPAEKAGIKPYDKIIEFTNVPVYRWSQLVEYIQKSEGKKINLTILRGGEELHIPVEVASARIEEPTGDAKTVGRIGIQPLISLAAPETAIIRSGPFKSLVLGARKTAEITILHVKVMANLIRGKVSMKNIGGPILIIKAASSSAREGLKPYLMMLSFISVGLAIINLFPIPLLDGGQMLLLSIEAIRRRPLSLRALEIVQHAGLVLLLSMMVFAFYNDVMRDKDSLTAFFRRFLDFFKG